MPRYASVAELAEKIGVSENYVRARLSLRKLTPVGRKALESDRITYHTARTICAQPSTVVPQIEDEVLHPKKYDRWHHSDEALTAEETQDLIHEKYVRELRGAPFQLNNPNLVPVHINEAGERVEGGPCTDCPWNTANQKEEENGKVESRKQRGRGRPVGEAKACLNPACYQKKVDVHVAAELVRAKEQGCTILSDKEAAKAIHEGGQLTYNSPYVKLDEKPDHSDRARNIESEKKLPSWGKIVTGEATPPVVIAVDRRGHVHRLVERKLAIAAARKNGTEKFLSLGSGRGQSSQGADYEEQKKREAEKSRQRGEAVKAIIAALVAAIEDRGVTNDFWAAARELAVRHAGHGGTTLFCKRRGLERKSDVYQAVDKALAKAEGSVLWGMIIELLLAEGFAYSASPHWSELVPKEAKPVLKLYGIDAKAIERATVAAAGERKKAKKKAARAVTSNTEHPTSNIEGGEEKPAKAARKPKPAAGISPESRAKLVAAMKARWAKRKGAASTAEVAS